jgi:hypothetical protein
VAALENEILAKRNAELTVALAHLHRQARHEGLAADDSDGTTSQRTRQTCHAGRRPQHLLETGHSTLPSDPSITVAEALTDDDSDGSMSTGATRRQVAVTPARAAPQAKRWPHPFDAARAPSESHHARNAADHSAQHATAAGDVATLSRGLHDLTLRLLFLCAEWMPSSSVELASVISGATTWPDVHSHRNEVDDEDERQGAPSNTAAHVVFSPSSSISPTQRDALNAFSQHARAIQHLEAVVRARFAAGMECLATAEGQARASNIEANEVLALQEEVVELRSSIAAHDAALTSSSDYLARSRNELAETDKLLRVEQRNLAEAQATISQLSTQLLDLERKNAVLEDAMAHLQLHIMQTPLPLHPELCGVRNAGGVGNEEEDDPTPHAFPPTGNADARRYAHETPQLQRLHRASPQTGVEEVRERPSFEGVPIEGLRTDLLIKVLRGMNTSPSPLSRGGENRTEDIDHKDGHRNETTRVTKLARDIFERAMQRKV